LCLNIDCFVVAEEISKALQTQPELVARFETVADKIEAPPCIDPQILLLNKNPPFSLENIPQDCDNILWAFYG